MHIHGPGVDIDVAPPDPVQQHVTRPDPAGLFHERREQAKLGRAQLQLNITACHAMRLGVQHDIVIGQHLTDTCRADPAQLGADARHQFGNRVGLDHIIIRTRFKPAHLVDLF